MRCLVCGEKTEKKVLCKKHIRDTDSLALYVTGHTCHSFFQIKDGVPGMCQNHLLCEPIKRALKGEILIVPNLGHVVCPHPTINLADFVYGKIEEKDIKQNYPECLE